MTNAIEKRSALVLLVEDDPGDQALTRRALDQGKIKIDLRIVNDGEEALEYLLHEGAYADAGDSRRPDLVLLDLNLPKMDSLHYELACERMPHVMQPDFAQP